MLLELSNFIYAFFCGLIMLFFLILGFKLLDWKKVTPFDTAKELSHSNIAVALVIAGIFIGLGVGLGLILGLALI